MNHALQKLLGRELEKALAPLRDQLAEIQADLGALKGRATPPAPQTHAPNAGAPLAKCTALRPLRGLH